MTTSECEAGLPLPDELTITRLPGGWAFRVDLTEDGAVLKAVKTRDDAKALGQVRRQVQIGLTR